MITGLYEHAEFSYFGKLPTHGDFLRYNAAFAGIHTFDQWLQAGILSVKKRMNTEWKTRFHQMFPYQFIYADWQSRQLVTGVLFPSQDKVGRTYPFFFTATFDAETFSGDLIARLPVMIAPFHIWVYQFFSEYKNNMKPQAYARNLMQFMKSSSEALAQMQVGYQQFKESETLSAFFSDCFSSPESLPHYRLLESLQRMVQTPDEHSGMRSKPGLRLTIPSNTIPAVYRLAGFLEIAGRLHAEVPFLPTLFWQTQQGLDDISAHALFFLDDLPAEGFQDLLLPNTESEMAALSGHVAASETDNDISLNLQQQTLSEFLSHLSSARD